MGDFDDFDDDFGDDFGSSGFGSTAAASEEVALVAPDALPAAASVGGNAESTLAATAGASAFRLPRSRWFGWGLAWQMAAGLRVGAIHSASRMLVGERIGAVQCLQ